MQSYIDDFTFKNIIPNKGTAVDATSTSVQPDPREDQSNTQPSMPLEDRSTFELPTQHDESPMDNPRSMIWHKENGQKTEVLDPRQAKKVNRMIRSGSIASITSSKSLRRSESSSWLTTVPKPGLSQALQQCNHTHTGR